MTTAAWPITRLPGPMAMPLLGWRGNSIRFLRDPLRYLQRSYQTYGPLSALVRDDPRNVFAIGPDYNHQLLSDARLFHTIFETITHPRVKRRRRGIGLLNMNGERHKQQRRLMMPAFHRQQIAAYHGDMVGMTQEVLDTWQPG